MSDIPPPVPDIVARLVRRAVPDGPTPESVCLRQAGEMRTSPGARWRRFSAEQTIRVREPAFAWRARLRVAPLVFADIVDSYEGGHGRLEVRLLGVLRVARAMGPAVDRGEAMRYLAELPWNPHAMRANARLAWREVGPGALEASLGGTAAAPRVRLIVEADDVRRIEADDRPRAVAHGFIPTRWFGRFDDYRSIGGYRIPTRAVVGWQLDDGPFEYWRGAVTAYRAG